MNEYQELQQNLAQTDLPFMKQKDRFIEAAEAKIKSFLEIENWEAEHHWNSDFLLDAYVIETAVIYDGIKFDIHWGENDIQITLTDYRLTNGLNTKIVPDFEDIQEGMEELLQQPQIITKVAKIRLKKDNPEFTTMGFFENFQSWSQKISAND